MPITMLDTVDPAALRRVASTSFEAVAGYGAGSWPDYRTVKEMFPHDHHLCICITAAEDGDCLDIERGDAGPADAPAWVIRQHKRGLAFPVLYANLSTMPAVEVALNQAGLNRHSYKLWVADYTYVPHIPGGYDACQWTDHYGGQNLNASLCLDSFFVENPAHHLEAVEHHAPAPKKHRLAAVKVRAKAVAAAPKRAAQKVHPKVAATTTAATVAAVISAVLSSMHVHVPQDDVRAATALLVFIAGYVAPNCPTRA